MAISFREYPWYLQALVFFALALLIILDAVLANSHRFIHAAMPVEAGLVEIP